MPQAAGCLKQPDASSGGGGGGSGQAIVEKSSSPNQEWKTTLTSQEVEGGVVTSLNPAFLNQAFQIYRDDGWKLWYENNLLVRMDTDRGRSITWTRDSSGRVLSIQELNGSPKLTCHWNGGTLESMTINSRTYSLTYADAMVNTVTWPDTDQETYTLSNDSSGNFILSLQYPNQLVEHLKWHGESKLLMSDNLWTYTATIRQKLDETGQVTVDHAPRVEGDGIIYTGGGGGSGSSSEMEEVEKGYMKPLLSRTSARGTQYSGYSAAEGVRSFKDVDGTLRRTVLFTGKGPLYMKPTMNTIRSGGTVITNARYFYNTEGRMTSEMDAMGRMTRYGYEYWGTNLYDNLKTKWVTNDLGEASVYHYDQYQQLTSVVNPLGQTNTFTYNTAGLLEKIRNPLGQTVVEYDYTVEGWVKEIKNGANEKTTFRHNADGLVTNVIDNAGKSWQLRRAVNGTLIQTVDPLGNTASFSYTDYQTVSTATNALGAVSTFLYNTNAMPTNVTDALGRVARMDYDEWDRLVLVNDPAEETTRFTYAATGVRDRLIDPLNRTNSFSHNVFHERAQWSRPALSPVQYSYNAAGELTLVTKPAASISYSYDAAGRLSSVTGVRGSSVYTNLFTRDAAGRLSSATTSTDGAWSWGITYTRDAAGRVVSNTQDGRTLQYAYDSAGRVSLMTYPSGRQVQYSYESRGLLAQIQSRASSTGSWETVVSHSFDNAGRLVNRVHGNGVEWSPSWNAANQMTNLVVEKPASWDKTFSYGYNAVGQRVWSRVDGSSGEAYEYDVRSQLTGVKYGVANPQAGYASATGAVRLVEYDYDAVGNRMERNDNGTNVVYSSDVANRYTSVVSGGQTNALTYHDAGELSTAGGWTYAYDAAGRLVKAEAELTRGEYSYDALGRRVEKKVFTRGTPLESWSLSSEFRFIYDGEDLIEETVITSTGTNVLEYIFAGGIDQPVAFVRNGTEQFAYHQDVLGNVALITDSSGQIAERYEYDAFGKATIRDSGSGILDSSTVGNRFQFTAREYDTETGLHHYRARSYSADLGRFLQLDPIDFDAGDVNLFRYCLNDPVNSIDPLGLWEWGNPATYFDGNPYGGSGFQHYRFMDTSEAAAATLDGINPFGDPFADMGAYDPCDEGLAFSRAAGSFAGDVYTGRLLLGGLARLGGTRHGNQLLNSNRYLRIGPGRMPARGRFPASPNAPRISIGRGPNNPHIDLRP